MDDVADQDRKTTHFVQRKCCVPSGYYVAFSCAIGKAEHASGELNHLFRTSPAAPGEPCQEGEGDSTWHPSQSVRGESPVGDAE